MATEREINLKLSAKADSAAAEPLREMAKSARDAARQESDLQSQLKQRASLYDLFRSSREKINALAKVELTEEQKYQELLKNRIRQYETAKRLKEDMARMGVGEAQQAGGGGMMGGLMGGLKGGMAAGAAEMAAILKLTDLIGQQMLLRMPTRLSDYNVMAGAESGLNKMAQQRREFEADAAAKRMLMKPFGWVGLSSVQGAMEAGIEADRMNAPFTIAQQNLAERQRAGERQAEREDRLTRRALQERQQTGERTQYEAMTQFGMNTASQQARTFLAGQRGINQFQAIALQGGAGYRRELAMQDVQGTIAYEMQRRQQEAESQRQQAITGAQLSAARDVEAQRRREYGEARAPLATLEKNLAAATSDEQVIERRNALEQQYKTILESEKRLTDAQSASKQLAVQQSEQLNQREQARLHLLEQESTRLQGIIRQEKEREVGRREEFGMLHPLQQRTYLGIARKLQMGMQLTQGEMQFARGAPGGMFEQRLRQIAMQRTGAGSMYEQIRGMLPELGVRETAAGKRLAEVTQQFQVEIKINEESLAAQLQKQVLPHIYEAIERAKATFEDENKRAQNMQAAQQKAIVQ